MTDQPTSHHPPDALDDLVANLLACEGVLSQVISHMVQFEASGHSVPDAAPIPEVAHSLIRSVVGPLAHDHSKRDIKTAAKIVIQVTDAIAREIHIVDPAWIDEINGGGDPRSN